MTISFSASRTGAGTWPRAVGFALGLAALLPTPVLAQDLRFGLELNNLEEVEGECRVTFVAHNATGVALDEAAYDVVVFDETGTVAQRLILEFGRLPDDKTRVVQFLLDRDCNRMSRLLLNGAEECRNEVGQNVPHCIDMLVTSSRVDVQFGS